MACIKGRPVLPQGVCAAGKKGKVKKKGGHEGGDRGIIEKQYRNSPQWLQCRKGPQKKKEALRGWQGERGGARVTALKRGQKIKKGVKVTIPSKKKSNLSHLSGVSGKKESMDTNKKE